MTWWRFLLILVFSGFLPGPAIGAVPKIKKVLPHFLDRQGQHTLSPSLYERDAYQDHLRRHPELRSGIRFDVLFKSAPGTNLFVRLELRGIKGDRPTTATLQSQPFVHKGGRAWQPVTLQGPPYQEAGEVLAWRATLWQGRRLLAEQRSFLW